MATWQAYVDTQLVATGEIDQACLLSKVDASVWGHTPEFLPRAYNGPVVQEDGTEKTLPINEATILVTVANTLQRPPEGLRINGIKYMPVRTFENGSAEDGVPTIYFKKPKGGGCLTVTNQCIIVATFDESKGMTAAGCNFAVETLARYLHQSGY